MSDYRTCFKVVNDTFTTGVGVFVGEWEHADIERKLRRWRVLEHDVELQERGAVKGCCWNLTYGQAIWLMEPPVKASQIATLSHELMHATLHTARQLGMQDDEFHCYYHDWLLKSCLKRIWKEMEPSGE